MHKGSKLNQSLITALAERYMAGDTTSNLAEEFKLSRATVSRALRKAGIQPERKDGLFASKEISPETEEAICDDYETGLSVLELCAKYKFSSTLINRIITKPIGDQPPAKKSLSEEQKQQICIKFLEQPYSKQMLAEEYGVHIDVINATLRKSGITVSRYIPHDIVEQFCKDFKDGVPLTDLVKIYQYNPESIRYWLSKSGLTATMDTVVLPLLAPQDIRNMARKATPEMLDILLEIARDGSVNPRTRATAAELVMDQGIGKPGSADIEELNTKESRSAQILKLIPSDLKNKLKKTN